MNFNDINKDVMNNQSQPNEQVEQTERELLDILNKMIHTKNKVTRICFVGCSNYNMMIKIGLTESIYIGHVGYNMVIKFDRWPCSTDKPEYALPFDINHFLQLMLRVIIEQTTQEKNNKDNYRKEYLFTFTTKIHREKIIKLLDKKTWEMFADVNFYGIEDYDNHIVCMNGDYSQIQKHFKIEVHPYEFFKFYETNGNMCNSDTIIIYICMVFDATFNDTKKMLWTQSNPNREIPNVFFTGYGHPHCLVCKFWYITTYGLSKQHKQANTWHDFLTKGCYDPRLLIFIEQFAANFCTIKDASKYDFVIYDDRVMVKRN